MANHDWQTTQNPISSFGVADQSFLWCVVDLKFGFNFVDFGVPAAPAAQIYLPNCGVLRAHRREGKFGPPAPPGPPQIVEIKTECEIYYKPTSGWSAILKNVLNPYPNLIETYLNFIDVMKT